MATGPDEHPDQEAALRGRVLAAHADLDRTRPGSPEYKRGMEGVIAATDALLARQEQQLALELRQHSRRAVAVLRPIGGAAAAAVVVVLVLASIGVISGWWWLLALPVLLGVSAVLVLPEPQPGAEFNIGVALLCVCVLLLVASVLELLWLRLLIPQTVLSFLGCVGFLVFSGSDALEREVVE